MIDSHSHLYCEAFDADRAQVVQRAREAGIAHVVLPNENLESLERQRAMKRDFPGFVSLTIGLHPEEVRDDASQQLAALKAQLDASRNDFVAVGALGVDLYWDKTWRDRQLEVLDTQLRWCCEYGLPFIIHCREALDEILWVMDNFGAPLPQGVFHSFTGSPDDVRAIARRGDFYFGVNGIVTFKKSEVKDILRVVGVDRLLLETDAPYLAPVPHRGKRNESAFLPAVLAFVAAWLGLDEAQVEHATTRNAVELFHLSPELLS